MGLMFGYQDCRKTLDTGWQGREGRRKGREYIHGLDKLCSASESCAILKVRVREKSKFCWLFWCGYTTPVFLPLYLRWFYYSTGNCLKIKLENYIIIAKETDFWLPKQACVIVLLISCPSFPFSVLTYCHFLSFFCLDWGFFCGHHCIDQFQKEFMTDSLVLWGVFMMPKCWCGVCTINYFSCCSERAVLILGKSSVPRGITGDSEIRRLLKLSKPTQSS